MKGLLLKDFLILKAQGKIYGAMLLVYAALSLAGNYSLFSAMLAVLMMILPLSSFTMDEQARWDKFAAALPDGRRRIVQCKYQFLLLLTGVVLVIGAVFSVVLVRLGRGGEMSLPELLLVAVTSCGVGLLINLLIFPFLFKYGSTKSRIILVTAFGVLFAVIALGAVLLKPSGIELSLLTKDLPSPVVLGVIAAAVLVVGGVVSYGCSMRIYANKEF